MAIEKAPSISQEDLLSAMLLTPNDKVQEVVNKVNETFEYWDTIKYKRCPEGCTPQQLWTYVKAARVKSMMSVWGKYGITLTLTNQMQRMCHEIDMNWGGSWGTDSIIGDENKEQYLVGSLMEEAIYSSQMEGAATTRKVAKEMLRKKMTPKDKSQQMIANNYQTIQFIVSHKDALLTPELLLQIHQLMTEHTMQNPQEAGCFRSNNDVVVENGITHETVHIPPTYEEIPNFVEDLCRFFNEQDAPQFIHPIIRGIIIHFMVAYVHPFADGNGRTARALFYWYMLKQGYWLTEYLSISRVIAKSKKSYEKAFLYTEADGMDMGYFVAYNMRVLQQSFKQLQDYIKRKQEEKRAANSFLRIGNINARQAQIIKMFADDSNLVVTIADLQAKFLVSPTTAKADVVGLMNMGLLSEISFNKVKKGYIKGEQFDEITKS
ncbi:Fic family protein [Segatella copri]|jgi:Fic family protein|uniref:Fic family protein n=1 Tax=Segatella copri TaxID=165179 RepID=A0A3E5DR05_9BACT|nr:Fic family protein [Segatella copri]MCW4076838.1 Fic family protein [Segatella copri]MCW4093506.1 Fic family protein [Segatella copri]MCW4109061.1 Fic family protein [Segatella copri]MEE1460350.1 Fic family protein [Segatella copri]RGN79041.1 Fic family protein [Segatella copri]